jgi:hypothetical protein
VTGRGETQFALLVAVFRVLMAARFEGKLWLEVEHPRSGWLGNRIPGMWEERGVVLREEDGDSGWTFSLGSTPQPPGSSGALVTASFRISPRLRVAVDPPKNARPEKPFCFRIDVIPCDGRETLDEGKFVFAAESEQMCDEWRTRLQRCMGGGWRLDQEARACAVCQAAFSAILRKHHCRACGCVCCNQCSTHRLRLDGHLGETPTHSFRSGEPEQPVRACDQCARQQYTLRLTQIYELHKPQKVGRVGALLDGCWHRRPDGPAKLLRAAEEGAAQAEKKQQAAALARSASPAPLVPPLHDANVTGSASAQDTSISSAASQPSSRKALSVISSNTLCSGGRAGTGSKSQEKSACNPLAGEKARRALFSEQSVVEPIGPPPDMVITSPTLVPDHVGEVCIWSAQPRAFSGKSSVLAAAAADHDGLGEALTPRPAAGSSSRPSSGVVAVKVRCCSARICERPIVGRGVICATVLLALLCATALLR